MTVKCCVCHRERVDGEWRQETRDSEGPFSHTYCPKCMEASLAEMQRLFQAKAAAPH